MKKKHITKRKIENDIREFLKQYDDDDSGDRSTAAYQLVFEVALWGGKNHFECLGILQEAMMAFRENSLEVLNDGENF
jgi:hypothetical protein